MTVKSGKKSRVIITSKQVEKAPTAVCRGNTKNPQIWVRYEKVSKMYRYENGSRLFTRLIQEYNVFVHRRVFKGGGNPYIMLFNRKIPIEQTISGSYVTKDCITNSSEVFCLEKLR